MNIYELRTTLKRRIQRLNMKAATFGINTPAEVSMEQEDINAVFKQIERVLRNKQLGAGPKAMAPFETRLKQLLTSGTLSIVVETFEYDQED